MDKIALTNVRVFDGDGLLEPATVVIDGRRIGTDPVGATTIDGDGRVLLPGLIDCHIHLTDEATLTALARRGVTTGLDMGTWPPELIASLRGRPGVTDIRSSGTGATHPASAHAQRMGRAQGLVADPDQALAELLRVSKPGGRLVICEFSHLPRPLLDHAYQRYLAATLPAIARVVSPNASAYAYLAESIKACPAQSDLADRIAAAGWIVRRASL